MSGCCNPLGSADTPAGPTQPFRGQYYVDPTFVGVSTGSASNPFRLFADAFAFAATAGVVSGIVLIPNGATIAENIVFPGAGAWELACVSRPAIAIPGVGATINGTIGVSSTTNRTIALTNLVCNGLISGSAAPTGNSTRLRLTMVSAGPVTLTGSGPGIWRLSLIGPSIAGDLSLNGGIGALAVTGDVYASNYTFVGPTSISGQLWMDLCESTGNFTYTGGAAVSWRIWRYNPNAGTSYLTTGGPLRLLFDPLTASVVYFNNLALGAGVTATIMNANGAQRLVLADNLGTQALVGSYPAGLIVVEASLQLLVPGTAGNAVLNAIYTDLVGVVRTVPVLTAPLNIAAAAGTEAQGAVRFQKATASGVAWNVTGIVTPGALSYSAAVNMRMAS